MVFTSLLPYRFLLTVVHEDKIPVSDVLTRKGEIPRKDPLTSFDPHQGEPTRFGWRERQRCFDTVSGGTILTVVRVG